MEKWERKFPGTGWDRAKVQALYCVVSVVWLRKSSIMAAIESSQGPLGAYPPVQVEMVLGMTVLSSNTYSISWAAPKQQHFLMGGNHNYFLSICCSQCI